MIRSREKQLLITMLSVYSFICALSGMLFVSKLTGITIPFTTWCYLSFCSMIPFSRLSTQWFYCISDDYSSTNKTAVEELLLFAALVIINSILGGEIYETALICLAQGIIFYSLSKNMPKIAQKKGYTIRRLVLMPPYMFVIVQSTVFGAALALTFYRTRISIVIYIIMLTYWIVWRSTVYRDRDKVLSTHILFTVVWVALIVLFYVSFLLGGSYGSNTNTIVILFRTIAFTFIFSGTIGVPALLEIIQIVWSREDITEEFSKTEKYWHYSDQLQVVRTIDLIVVIIAHFSWVFLHYNLSFFLLYAIGSTATVILSRHHYVRQNTTPYRGSWAVCLLWPIVPGTLVVVERYSLLPTLSLYGVTSEHAISVFGATAEVLCIILGWLRFKTVEEARNAFQKLGLVGTHVVGLGITAFLLMVAPFQAEYKSVALFVICLEIISEAGGYFTSYSLASKRKKK